MSVILFFDGQQKVRANFFARQLRSCLSFSTRNKTDYELFLSQYNPNQDLKYDLSEKDQYFTVRISYFKTNININQNISI